MLKQTILLALAGLASATGDECCTIYSEKNYQGESHDLCFDSNSVNIYAVYTSVYRLSDIHIDWDIASISCGDVGVARAGYTVCKESDSNYDCGAKSWYDGFGWLTYGDNADLTDVDIPVIGITAQHNDAAVTIYQSNDCTGPSFSHHDLVDIKTRFQKSANLKDEQKIGDGYQKTDVDVSKLASIRVPSGVAVNLYGQYDDSSALQAFMTIYGDEEESC